MRRLRRLASALLLSAGAFQTVSAGGYHSCGLRADDTITCWGSDNYGQAAAPAGAFQTVSAGSSH